MKATDKQKLAAQQIKDIVIEKYYHLMACSEHQQAITFCMDTKQIVEDGENSETLDREDSEGLRAHIDGCITAARIARYNAEWDVNLEA